MDWIEFLDTASIDWVSSGPNTKRGEISVQCPWCGQDDPSQHLGISLESENWGCLRNGAHRGHNPERLIAALLGCSHTQAKLVVRQYSRADPDRLPGPLTEERPASEPGSPEEMPDYRSIQSTGITAKFWRYLASRGFDPHKVTSKYGLVCCLSGKYKDRILIPFHRNGRLVAWTGRAIINPRSAPRYLSSNLIKTVLFNEDSLVGGSHLFIVEGPFDAIKLDYHGATATCISGANATPEQIQVLHQICRSYERVTLLLDTDAVEQAYVLIDWLPRVELGQLPEGIKDPGELTKEQINGLVL